MKLCELHLISVVFFLSSVVYKKSIALVHHQCCTVLQKCHNVLYFWYMLCFRVRQCKILPKSKLIWCKNLNLYLYHNPSFPYICQCHSCLLLHVLSLGSLCLQSWSYPCFLITVGLLKVLNMILYYIELIFSCHFTLL